MGGRVLVLGAGAGGLIAANLLAHAGYSVTLVEKSEYHLFQPGMLWIAFKGHDPSRYVRRVDSLVRPGVELVKGVVLEVDLADRRVRLSDGRELSYDYLVVALGASYDYDAVEGNRELVEKYGDFYSGVEAARRLWESFSRMKSGRLVVATADPVYKCPPAPHKAVFLAVDSLRERGLRDRVEVHLALPFVHEYPSEVIARIVKPRLEEAGVVVHTTFTVESVDLEAGRLKSLEGEELEFDVAAIIPAHRGPEVKVKPEEAVDEDGYFKVDKYTLRIEGYDDAYAVGDCTNVPTSKTGVTAHLGAEVVAYRIMGYSRVFTGRTNCPLVTDGEAIFVISDYDHPPVPARFTQLKRVLEDLFIASYWSSLKYPEKWGPVFEAYFEATSPRALGSRGW